MVSFFFLVMNAGRFSTFMLKALTELSVLFKRGRVLSTEDGRVLSGDNQDMEDRCVKLSKIQKQQKSISLLKTLQ